MRFPVRRFLQRWKSAIRLKRLFIISKKSTSMTITMSTSMTITMSTSIIAITTMNTMRNAAAVTTITMNMIMTSMSITTMTMTTIMTSTAAAATTTKVTTMRTMFSRAWASKDGQWIHFDYVPGEPDVRTGAAGVTGRICVIGSEIDRDKILKLFEI